MINAFALYRGYTGHEHIDLFDLVNMDGRVYDPVIGRFLNADPVIQDPENLQSLNRYSYCLNNPLTLIDPGGYSWLSRNWKSLVSAIVSITVAAVVSISIMTNIHFKYYKVKKYIILLLFVFNASISNTQSINAEYNYDEVGHKFSFTINLYKSGDYCFDMTEYITNDVVLSTSISSGTYKIVRNKMILSDSYHKYKMIFKYNKRCLISEQTFYKLKNKTFLNRGKTSNIQMNCIETSNAKANRLPENNNHYTLYFSTYLAELVDYKYSLSIFKPNSFLYSYNDYPLLRGTFTRKKNELILYDISLNHCFIFSIYKKSLIENFLVHNSKLSMNLVLK